MDEPINYSHADIQRYLNHQMTKGEMHAFEKAMMRDPFLTDALEGYQNANSQVTELHLRDIEKNIATQKEEKAIAPVITKQFNWWRVAAVLLPVIGACSFYYFNSLSKPSENFAANAPLFQQDSIGPEVKLAVPPQLFLPKKENDVAKNSTPLIAAPPANDAVSMSATNSLSDTALMAANQSLASLKSAEVREIAEAASQARMMRKSDVESSNRSTHEITGKILDEDGDPVAFATVSSNKGVAAITDAKGNFSIKTPDSIVDVTIAGLGYNPITARLYQNNAQHFQLVENTKDLSDLVVSSMGRKKKFDVTTDKNEYLNKETGYKPLKGWRHLNNYLLKNINTYREESDEYMSGDVEIDFKINKNGRPVNIHVVEASDDPNAAKAIELIQNGPLWKKGKPGIKARLLISF